MQNSYENIQRNLADLRKYYEEQFALLPLIEQKRLELATEPTQLIIKVDVNRYDWDYSGGKRKKGISGHVDVVSVLKKDAPFKLATPCAERLGSKSFKVGQYREIIAYAKHLKEKYQRIPVITNDDGLPKYLLE